jgi:hypothetical protein
MKLNHWDFFAISIPLKCILPYFKIFCIIIWVFGVMIAGGAGGLKAEEYPPGNKLTN